jgi:hypothetical protein
MSVLAICQVLEFVCEQEQFYKKRGAVGGHRDVNGLTIDRIYNLSVVTVYQIEYVAANFGHCQSNRTQIQGSLRTKALCVFQFT